VGSCALFHLDPSDVGLRCVRHVERAATVTGPQLSARRSAPARDRSRHRRRRRPMWRRNPCSAATQMADLRHRLLPSPLRGRSLPVLGLQARYSPEFGSVVRDGRQIAHPGLARDQHVERTDRRACHRPTAATSSWFQLAKVRQSTLACSNSFAPDYGKRLLPSRGGQAAGPKPLDLPQPAGHLVPTREI